MKEYIQSIRFDKNLIRQDPISGVNHLTEKFAVKVTDMQNKAIVQAVRETAEKHGITQLLMIDENFIVEAIECYTQYKDVVENYLGKTVNAIYRHKMPKYSYYYVSGECVGWNDNGILVFDPDTDELFLIYHGEYTIGSIVDLDQKLKKEGKIK